ncbi:MAG TPA: hypothetical protein VFH68_17965 [Polyangia bacterium]|jgi:serine/threonine-protein kinase|nr:hypothetical protein [Polyangia bacterium]
MAPEQATGLNAAVDARADQFALAGITYEMLTGQPPFSGDTVMALAYQIVHVDPIPAGALVKHLPAGVDAVLMRGLAKRPEDRFAEVGDLVSALYAAAAEDQPSSPAESASWRSGSSRGAASASGLEGTRLLSTTLSGANGQTDGRVPRTRRLAAGSVVLAAIIGAAISVLLFARGRPVISNPPRPRRAGSPPGGRARAAGGAGSGAGGDSSRAATCRGSRSIRRPIAPGPHRRDRRGRHHSARPAARSGAVGDEVRQSPQAGRDVQEQRRR